MFAIKFADQCPLKVSILDIMLLAAKFVNIVITLQIV